MQKPPRVNRSRTLLFSVALFYLSSFGTAPFVHATSAHASPQDQGPQKEQVDDGPPPLPGQGGGDLQQELLELFAKVERNLMEVDIKLSDAGAGEAILEGVPDAGLDDLLRAAQEHGKQAQSQMDRILEIAAQLDQNKSNGSSQSKPGKQSQDQSQKQGPQEREKTPEAPKPGEGEEKQEQSEKEKPSDSQADDPSKTDEQDRGNKEGQPPADEEGKRTPHDSEVDKWGFLPPRQRETFRNQGRDDLPVQYRQWIDTYYRRLNRDQG